MWSVTTWNINGLRTTKDLKLSLDSLDSDIICIQETKITREMLTEPLAIVPGYSSYFDFSQRRSGYSGVATYCRDSATPLAAEPGLAGSRALAGGGGGAGLVGCYGAIPAELEPAERTELDAEGRCLVTVHRLTCQCAGDDRRCRLAVVNVYCPRVDPDRPERLRYKLLFYAALRRRAAALRAAGHHVLVVGDLNCSHRPIDTCEPGDLAEFSSSPSRQFMDSWLCEPPPAADSSPAGPQPASDDDRLVDTFRHLHPAAAEAYTCWNTQKDARQLNYGTRIDYVLADVRLAARLQSCDQLTDVLGSDHCPVRAVVAGRLLAEARCPPAATRHYPEFAGRQLTLRDVFTRLPPAAQKRPPPAEPRRAAPAPPPLKRARSGQTSLLTFVRRSAKDTNGTSDRTAAADGASEAPTGTPVNAADCAAVPEPALFAAGASRDPQVASFWRQTLKTRRPPACRGHREPCVQRVVKKAGPNVGKLFWCCARGVGKPGDPLARCGHFEWLQSK